MFTLTPHSLSSPLKSSKFLCTKSHATITALNTNQNILLLNVSTPLHCWVRQSVCVCTGSTPYAIHLNQMKKRKYKSQCLCLFMSEIKRNNNILSNSSKNQRDMKEPSEDACNKNCSVHNVNENYTIHTAHTYIHHSEKYR